MNAYLSAEGTSDERIRIPESGHVEIFRVSSRDNEVVSQVVGDDTSEIIPLGVRDRYVSRRGTDADPSYIELYIEDDQLFVVDNGMDEPVRLEEVFETIELTHGESYIVHRDAKLGLGFATELQLTIEREQDEVPMLEYIDQCRRWIMQGPNREALRSARGIFDRLERSPPPGEAGEPDPVEQFEGVLVQLENQVERGEDRSDESVPPDVRRSALDALERLRQLYTRR